MTEIFFYHLQRQSLEAALPPLLAKSLERGWRVVVQGGNAERLALLDDHLWTYAEESFLPHAREGEEPLENQPVALMSGSGNPNKAQVRFLVDAAPLPEDMSRYERIVLMFDGRDEEAVALAREQWKAVKSSGMEATYWKQDASGRWSKQA